MSYILDALRKSEQQRTLGAVPTLPAAQVTAAAPERPATLLFGLTALLAVIATVTAAAWLRPWAPEPPALAVVTAKPVELPARPLAPPVPPAGVAPQLSAPLPAAPQPAAVSVPAPVALVAPRKAGAAPGTGTRSMAPMPVAKEMSGEASHTSTKAVSALPPSVRRQLPPMAVAVHAYSNTAADRLVSINGRMLREGDALAPDLKLEQITPDGMVFSYRGYRFRRSAQ